MEIGWKSAKNMRYKLMWLWLFGCAWYKMQDGLHLHHDATDLSRENKIGAEVPDPYDQLNLFTTGDPNIYTLCPRQTMPLHQDGLEEKPLSNIS